MIAGIPAAFREQITQATALGRLGTAADIAGVVALLASPAGYWINGQTLYADGGLRG